MEDTKRPWHHQNPLSWEDLDAYANDKDLNHIKLHRTTEIEEKYVLHTKMVKEMYGNIDTYILKEVIKNNEILLIDNAFPYSVQPGIKHKLLWISPSSKTPIDNIVDAQNYIETHLWIYADNPVIIFVNCENNKSVKSIAHFHVFVKE
jgi:hypothetical protein